MKEKAKAARKKAADDGDDPRFAKVLEAFANEPKYAPVLAAYASGKAQGGRKFGSNGLKVNGKLFALFTRGKLVVKLSKVRADGLVASRAGEYLDPGHGRKMKQWVEIGSTAVSWVELAKEAHDFVKAAKP